MQRLEHSRGPSTRLPASGLRVRHCLDASGGGKEQWLFRHDDPGDQVGKETDAGHEGHDQPYHAHQGDIDIEIFGEPKTYSRDFASHTRPYQPDSGHGTADTNPAVSADRRVVLNHFSAIVAVHGALPLAVTQL